MAKRKFLENFLIVYLIFQVIFLYIWIQKAWKFRGKIFLTFPRMHEHIILQNKKQHPYELHFAIRTYCWGSFWKKTFIPLVCLVQICIFIDEPEIIVPYRKMSRFSLAKPRCLQNRLHFAGRNYYLSFIHKNMYICIGNLMAYVLFLKSVKHNIRALIAKFSPDWA